MGTSIHKLDTLNNFFGPLSKEVHARLRAVLSEPTERTWENAYSLILRSDLKGMNLTLWQAVRACDPSFPNVKYVTWRRIPDRDLLIRAIEYAQALTPDEVKLAAPDDQQ